MRPGERYIRQILRQLRQPSRNLVERCLIVSAASFSCLSNNRNNGSAPKMSGQRSNWRERLRANPSRMEQELAFKLQEDGIHYQTQVEIPITTADFYFPLESRPLLVFIDGRVHLGTRQTAKDEELRSLL